MSGERPPAEAMTLARSPRAGPLLGVLIGVAVVVADILVGQRLILIGLVIVAPLLASLTATVRTTESVAVGAVAASALSGLWNDSYDKWYLWVPLAVVTAGSLAAIAVARLRERNARELARMQMLAEIARLAGGSTVADVAHATTGLIVPRLGDVCLFQLVSHDGDLHPLDVRSAGEEIPPVASSISVDLRAGERRLGVLTVGRTAARPAFTDDDRRFVGVFAGRVALALDNAGLTAQLSTTEQQLQAILRQIDAAIMVRDVHGRLVYANEAATRILGVPDVDAIRRAAAAELMELFEVYDEDGEPVALSDLPGARVLAGDESPAPVVVRNIVRATGEERWLVNKATPIRDERGQIVMAVNVIDDVTATKRREIAQRLLAEGLRALSSSLDLEQILQALCDMAVPGLADWATADVLDARGDIRPMAIAHRDPEKVRLGRHLKERWPVDPEQDTGLPGVIATGVPELLADITDDMLVAGAQDPEHLAALRAVGLRSAMIVPMLSGDEVVGALSFVSSTARRFDRNDLALAVDLGRQAGVAVRNAQLFAQRQEIAHTLQTGLLPGGLPDVPAWDLAAFYRPAGLANEAGGDFYDAVRAPDGWVLMVGDVAGKGAVAAALTAVARYTLRTAIQLTGDPVRALAHLNDALLARDDLSLCTVALVRLPDDGSEIEVVTAGHPFPLHRSGSTVAPVGATGAMLGAFADATWSPAHATLRPDDGLVLFTDGVLDVVGTDGRFGGRRLEAVLRDAGTSADELVAAVRQATDEFAAGPQPDDVAVLAVRRTPVAAPAG